MTRARSTIFTDSGTTYSVYTSPMEAVVTLSMETENTEFHLITRGDDFSPDELETMAVRFEIMASRYVSHIREEAMRKRGTANG